MMSTFFDRIPPVRYAGPDSDDPLSFRYYDAEREVLGKSMAEHLRMAVCYWHTFCWQGDDVFGDATFGRPWHAAGEPGVQRVA